MKKTLIFWRTFPLDVNLGVFEYVLNNWEGKIIVVSQKGFPEERKACGWGRETALTYESYVLSEMENGEEFSDKLLIDNKDAIHIFAGIRGKNEKRICKLKQISKEPKIVIIAERPARYSSGLKGVAATIMRYFIYFTLAMKHRNSISAFLAMGEKGVSQYAAYGFKRKTLFQYMYCPVQPELKRTPSKKEQKVKFLYIGRFDRKIKGVDTLISAVEAIPDKEGWTIDLVGGYGEYADKTIVWCNQNVNANYLDRWDFDEVCQKMTDYDVCIVPSKYDGWNLSPNQAIHAGIATIVSDQAISDELIKYSGAGIVFPARNAEQLKKAMIKVIDNPKELEKFKEKAVNYANLISPSSVGQYVMEILEYVEKEKKERPKCPWRTEKI